MLNRFPKVLAASALAASLLLSAPKERMWSLQPVVRPEVPAVAGAANPIDAFIDAQLKAKGLRPAGQADKRALLRRVYLDLIGIPPTPEEQDAFLKDTSPDAYEKVVDKLLANDQHGVRYARHWLDVLRYADADERMYAAPGIHLWRDWVIHALNRDMPYDEFVRTQLTGYRNERTRVSDIGIRSRLDPQPEDLFALGFLARGSVARDGKDTKELPIVSVETVSTAFMGMTVGCAKCHDHKFDPITQEDFYRMKALFDPLVVKKIALGMPADMYAIGDTAEDARVKREAAEAPLKAELEKLTGDLRRKLEEERVLMLAPDVQAMVRKPEKQRTAAEQKVVDDYLVPLRVDAVKVRELLPEDVRKRVQELERQIAQLGQGGGGGGGGGRRGGRTTLPVFWTVEVDRGLERDPNYVLGSGEVDQPQKDRPVQPGWPFQPERIDFRDGRVEAFADWLTEPANPLFARVAVNRLWQWHFGEGIQKSPSDFGLLGGLPTDRKLLDWLAAEFVDRKFSMKQMHKLMLTSNAYKRASSIDSVIDAANTKIDPANDFLWKFRLLRLDAEQVWDSVLSSAGNLDLTIGGASFDIAAQAGGRGGGGGANRPAAATPPAQQAVRRGAYIIRGFSTSRDVVPTFLQAFDVDDGRLPCPERTRTVTAPQALFLMNSEEVEKASAKLSERLLKASASSLPEAVDLGFAITLGRPPSPREKDQALSYVKNEPGRLKGFAWLLFNMDEFVYVR